MVRRYVEGLRRRVHRAIHSVVATDVVDIDAVVARVLQVVANAHGKSWPAERGNRTVYVRVGVWREGDKVYAAVPAGGASGSTEERGLIKSYGPDDPEYYALRHELEHWERW